MKKLIVLLSALLYTCTAVNYCVESCDGLCKDVACVGACVDKCKMQYRFNGSPYFRLSLVHLLPEGTVVTGSDSPPKPRSSNIYFTTLGGRVYRYNGQKNTMNTVLTIPPQRMDLSNGKGLYDIAFHRDFEKNGLLYLHYAVPPPTESSDRFRDHDNVITEYQFTGLQVDEIREIRRIPQFTSERSGGWTKMGLRDQIVRGPAWLYVAVGGNKEELISRNQGSPALSTIYSIAEPNDRAQVAEKVWASGIQNPIDCDASIFKAGRILCLIEDTQGLRHVHSLHKGYNYGSDKYVNECLGHSCAQQYSSLASRDALVSFSPDECPVESIQMYTGHAMNNYKLSVFLTRSACFDARSNEFKPAEIIRIYRDHSSATFNTVVMSTDFVDDLLVNTTLVGADKFDEFYIAGYALRTGQMALYRIVPVKAAE